MGIEWGAGWIAVEEMDLDSELGAGQPIQAYALLSSLDCQGSMEHWGDAHTELSAVMFFSERLRDGFLVGLQVVDNLRYCSANP